MNMHGFEIANYILAIILTGILLKYLWDRFSDRDNEPDEWKLAKKKGKLDSALLKLERNYPDKVRFFNWWLQAERLRRENVPGAFAELGVYKGDSARILHCMDSEREFHLFDTFEGFTITDLKEETGDAASYTQRNFSDTSVRKVRERVGDSEKIRIHPGHFPETAKDLAEMKFSLVNIDADLYLPTKAGLEFFYPRLSPGGVILVHDHNSRWKGILRAIAEFSGSIPESTVIIPDKEGTAMIVRNKSID
ncbi:MAG: TylF/MycF/NovP-related O-methyltransferase [Bacteroidota bacterium]|nr:TylF/MycF/NovP-related O-methyltransferase [Bacteroidota bacterium]